ncbi:MAG: FkbM family methyltransferase [Verrucomicrobia bacterium]|nr:FkbM family methyltransferase [Verrucomicrobiota bacterium]
MPTAMKNIIYKKICDHSFLINFIKNNAVVLDCGANRGQFSRWLINNGLFKIYGFEPDPRIFPNLNEIRGATFYKKAVSANNGQMNLCLNDGIDGTGYYDHKRVNSTYESVVVNCINLDTIISENKINEVGLLKIDVEGAEIEIILNMSEKMRERVSQITVEFHDFIDKNEIPRIRKCIQSLKSSGFRVYRMSFFDYSDVLFINKSKINLNLHQRIYLRFIIKFGSGIKRIISRIIGCK